jgi:CHASE2 domain-containing sensor protein
MPGVIAQAQMVSQILSAVKDGRALLWVWPLWGDILWVWSWSLVGGVLAWRCRSTGYLGVSGGAALGVLYGFCFGLSTQSGWVPLVPSALALVATGCSVAVYTRSQT